MKLIEQLVGNGDVIKDSENLGKVSYRLYVYQEIVEGEEGLKKQLVKLILIGHSNSSIKIR